MVNYFVLMPRPILRIVKLYKVRVVINLVNQYWIIQKSTVKMLSIIMDVLESLNQNNIVNFQINSVI